MDKEKVIELLSILDYNDCLHSEWNWRDGEGNLTDDSEWVVSEINKLLN